VSFDQTHWIPVQRRGPLPTFYYHEHFVEMLDFVATHYAHVLLPEHLAFLKDFGALPREAQCLYVRLINRKGRILARNRLRYPELSGLDDLLQVLLERGWVEVPDACHFDDVLRFLTRSDIYAVLLPRFTGLGRSLKKAQLIEFARTHMCPEVFMKALGTRRVLAQRRADEVRYLMFLYFGRVHDSLSQFTMRDLGLVRTQGSHESYEPRFLDREEALEHYYFATRLKDCERIEEGTLSAWVAEARDWPAPNFPGSATLRDQLAHRLGRKAEQTGDVSGALELYSFGESAECGERHVRLLLANGARDEARGYLEKCLADPRSDEEWFFACDLYERKFNKKRTSALTDALRAAATIDIDESRNGSPERAVIEYLTGQGAIAFRTENLIWRSLFGLLFWEELFADDGTKAHSPFDFLPASLVNGSFYAANRERVEKKLAWLGNPALVKRQLLQTSTRHYGSANGVFRWRRSTHEALFALLDHATPGSVESVLRGFCIDFDNSRYGYPDLMCVDSEGLRFIEVKTEGDQLRRNQLLRLRQLQESGFRAEILRVRWVLDPEQTYVVVDVETTGGRGEDHRITEIGAVKIRDGEIVDRFQTLLNPQRSIPPGIVRLTGITPAMVEEAPYFIDVADAFETFIKDAIFVAHNVEFDYGFVAREYARIGRPFRYPKLCTCASMRKLFPGRRSYSLSALCGAFDIPLPQHHRALCDAEAAAALLQLINEKRQAA
jgi:DNA polymerase-3 subunit epsilon